MRLFYLMSVYTPCDRKKNKSDKPNCAAERVRVDCSSLLYPTRTTGSQAEPLIGSAMVD